MDGHTVVSDVTHTNIFMSEKQKKRKILHTYFKVVLLSMWWWLQSKTLPKRCYKEITYWPFLEKVKENARYKKEGRE